MRRIALSVLGALALAPAAARAGQATSGPMTVTATVSNNCTISLPAAVSVATDTLSDASTTAAVSVACTKGTSYAVTLASANAWTLKSGATALNYVVYQPKADGSADTSQQWDASHAWSGLSAGRAAKALTFTLVVPAQDVAAGTYTDSVTATVNF